MRLRSHCRALLLLPLGARGLSSGSSGSLATRTLQLLVGPAQGKNRAAIAADAVRPWSCPMVWTHSAFVPPALAAAAYGVDDLALLQTATLCLSLAYHRNYERPGALARCEGVAAKALFVYGTAQLFHCPSDAPPGLFALEGACFAVSLGSFLATNLSPALYDRWHPLGLHVVPGVWAFAVATHHAQLPWPWL